MIKKIIFLALTFSIHLQGASASVPRFKVPATINTPVCQISQAWAQSCVQNLNKAEILLLANTLYFSHSMAQLMATLRYVSDVTSQTFIEIQLALTYDMVNLLVDQCTKQLIFRKELMKEKELLESRRAHCNKKINEERKINPAFDQAVSEFQEICQSALRVHMDNRAFDLVNDYTVTKLPTTSRDLKALTDELKSFHEITEGPKVFAIGTRLANSLEAIGHTILWDSANISQKSSDMEKLTTALFAQLYTDLFNALPQEQQDSLKQMFDSKGLIQPERRFLMLPFPDHLHREISEL